MDDGIDVMRIADFDEVKALWEGVEMWPHLGEDRDWFERALARNPGGALVWREGGRVVGTVIGAWDGLRGWIYHLAVTEDFRTRGTGSALLKAAEERLRQMGVNQINLMVYEENGYALEFYARRGYERSPVKVARKRFSASSQ
jgi:ribosomal protein S18 acetylase RimI-like enzyme